MKAYITLSLFFIGVLCLIPKDLFAQSNQAIPDRFYTDIHKRTSDTSIAKAYINLATYYTDRNIDSVKKYLELSKKALSKLKINKFLAALYNTEGIYYNRLENYKESIEAYKKAAYYYKLDKDPWQYTVQGNMAFVYIDMADYKNALKISLENLTYFDKNNDLEGIAFSKGQIGLIYSELKKDEEALKYQLEAKNINEKIKDFAGLSANLERIGTIYLEKKQFDKALLYYFEQLQLTKREGFLAHQATSLNNIGLCYLEMRKYEEAISYIQESLTIRIKIGNVNGIISCYQKLIACYINLNQLDKALAFSTKANELLKGSNNADRLIESETTLAELNFKQENFKEAYTHLQKSHALNDSLRGVKQKNEVESMFSTFENEKRAKVLELLRKSLLIEKVEKEKNQEKILRLETENTNVQLSNSLLEKDQNLKIQQLSQQETILKEKEKALALEKRLRLLMVLFLLLVMIILIALVLFWQTEKRNRRKAENFSSEISAQKLELQQVNATKDKLFSIIAHELRSPIAHLQTALWAFQADNDSSKLTKNIGSLNNQVNTVNATIDNLLVWSIQQLEGYNLKMKQVSLKSVVDNTLKLLEGMLSNKNISVVNKITHEIICTDEKMLEVIVRNLLSNAIKFSAEKSFIKIDFATTEKYNQLIIQDTGIGISEQQQQKIFEGFETKKGTSGETGVGLGLLICKELMEIQQGTIAIESHEGNGTKVVLSFPLC